ncbi:gamma-aminobutyric acid receptor subunit beta-4-like [Mercenaria mercenaria]|uniref:gamma-aminobutyric acid receptor subunit beta-4-like n=1 Tax=Mercenaria mercenaria TaxID=6596 RepID=UPI00234EB2EA|nr:gamma-aminobutyric acid receptor subunit beta-4-like [Mercenaria mercenaria]
MSDLLTFFNFFVFVAAISGQNMLDVEPTRYDMMHYLVDDRRYDPSLPPDFYIGNSTTVSVELFIYDLNSENDMNMEYECTLYLRMKWTDQRLDFTENKTSYDTLSLGDTSVGKLWLPDLYFHHEREAELHGLFTKNQLVYIHKNGSVLYSGR